MRTKKKTKLTNITSQDLQNCVNHYAVFCFRNRTWFGFYSLSESSFHDAAAPTLVRPFLSHDHLPRTGQSSKVTSSWIFSKK